MCVVVPSLARGGAERSCVKLCNSLAGGGWDVHLVALADSAEQIDEPLDGRILLRVLSGRRSADPRLWWELRRTLSAIDPQVVFGWTTYAALATLVASRFGEALPVVVCERNYLPLAFGRAQTRPARRLATIVAVRKLYPTAALVTANSQGAVRFLQRWLRGRAQCRHLPNSIAAHRRFDRYDDDPHVPEQWRHGRVLALGRLNFQKGFDILLRALALAPGQPTLLVAGAGPEEGALRRLCAELRLSERVLWAGATKNPFAYYTAADVLVLPSRYEGFPNVMLEAMATGCPVIATRCRCGPEEMSENGRFARLVPVNDSAALAEAIRETLAAPEAARSRAAEGRDHVLRTYSDQESLTRAEALIREASAIWRQRCNLRPRGLV